MKSGQRYIFITFLSLFLFSHQSFSFDVLPQEESSTHQGAQYIKKSLSIDSVIERYHPLRLFSLGVSSLTLVPLTLEPLKKGIHQLYKIKPSIQFDKSFNDPVSYHFRDSSIEEKKIQLNITIKF